LAYHWRLINPYSRLGVHHLSITNIDLDYDNERKAKKVNNVDFQIKTDPDSCKEISRCTVTKNHKFFWRYDASNY
jgi:hypothetical protein